jgi:probable HAF family extracellular repeat protein
MRLRIVLVIALSLLASEPARATAIFIGLGFTAALDISDDGTVVVGALHDDGISHGVRWTADDGVMMLGDLGGSLAHSVAEGTSGDGSVAVGSSPSPSHSSEEAYRWTSAGMVGLGTLAGAPWSDAWEVSADGAVVVGSSENALGAVEAFRWTATEGMAGLGFLTTPDPTSESIAFGASADGSIVVGRSHSDSTGSYEAFIWTESTGMVGLGALSTEGGSDAMAVTPDGTIVVGSSENEAGYGEAFLWTEGGGMIGLGVIGNGSSAEAVSADGSVVVGQADDPAFIWTAELGMRNLENALVNEYGLDLTGWGLVNATGVSADGTRIVGWGLHDGELQAWLVALAATCRSLHPAG